MKFYFVIMIAIYIMNIYLKFIYNTSNQGIELKISFQQEIYPLFVRKTSFTFNVITIAKLNMYMTHLWPLVISQRETISHLQPLENHLQFAFLFSSSYSFLLSSASLSCMIIFHVSCSIKWREDKSVSFVVCDL